MPTHQDKTQKPDSKAISQQHSQTAPSAEAPMQFVDQRPEAANQQELAQLANSSPQVQYGKQMEAIANQQSTGETPIQRQENNTGMPDQLKSGVESLSGFSMDDVRVHRNSAKPAQLQANAYAQGSDIHLGPGQERHLPHEAWHVAQQKAGRVKPTMQMGGAQINDDRGLEKEADRMGGKAMTVQRVEKEGAEEFEKAPPFAGVVQRGVEEGENVSLPPISGGTPQVGQPRTGMGRGFAVGAGAAPQARAEVTDVTPASPWGQSSLPPTGPGRGFATGAGATPQARAEMFPHKQRVVNWVPPGGQGRGSATGAGAAPAKQERSPQILPPLASRPGSASSVGSTEARAGDDVGNPVEIANRDILLGELNSIHADFSLTKSLYDSSQNINGEIAKLDRLRIANYLARLQEIMTFNASSTSPAPVSLQLFTDTETLGNTLLAQIDSIAKTEHKKENLQDKFLWLRILSEILKKPEEVPGLLQKLKEKQEDYDEGKGLAEEGEEVADDLGVGVEGPTQEIVDKEAIEKKMGPLESAGKGLSELINSIKEWGADAIQKVIDFLDSIKGAVESVLEWVKELPVLSHIIPFLGPLKDLALQGIGLKGAYDRYKTYSSRAGISGISVASPDSIDKVNSNNNQQIKEKIIGVGASVVGLIGDILTATGVGAIPGLVVKGAIGVAKLGAGIYRFFRNKLSTEHEQSRDELINIIITEMKQLPVEQIEPPTHGPGFLHGESSDEHARMQMHYKMAAAFTEQVGIGLLQKLRLEHVQGSSTFTDLTPDKIREIMEGTLDDMTVPVS